MRSFGKTSAAALIATASLFNSVAAQVDPIVIKGSKFFYKTNGTQFYMRGVAYQQDYTGGGTVTAGSEAQDSYIDPLADVTSCRRDVPYLQQLYTNTIRVYALDPTKDHDECMSLLADAGIYVIADLSTPTVSINRDTPSWNDELYARYTSVVDAMAGYTNTLGFFAGNEVSNAPNNTEASAFVKAAVRDMKSYISNQGYRTIGVGYATNDDADIRVNMADYFNCGDPAEAIDFWGYNIYSWCGDSSYTESGYDVRTQEFSSYSVPAFFAEYGCNDVQPRQFTEVQALYGPQMSDVWSGGIVYMYFQEANDYGLVQVSGNTVTKLPDFTNLQRQLARISPEGVEMGSYSPANQPASCPTGSDWSAVADPLPPTPNAELCSCMTEALSCVVSSTASEKQYGDLFGYVCGNDPKACIGISANASTGEYGAYSMCSPSEQISFVFNQYYKSQGSSDDSCSFKGAAELQQPQSGGSSCKSLIAQAGTAGTGTVTSAPNGGGGSAGAASSSAAASANIVPSSVSGLLPMAAVVILAALSGMGVVLF